eukprot:CAMPEP_0115272812 /NCGR_PEP_ID=MMETSP0270-20121206/54820_1 /TAXON_ID=71861 /ORGANISM="Scrippsiella trochoidea, Strain CCMP3099" /LENGTH=550 /DNA_ID=CAMNT_0002689239 /DNA_START=78 /DNA_END=1728 /DNA_ORIENTATION=-
MTRNHLTLEDASLLRGVSHFAVLRQFGRLLTNNTGRADTYDLSETTESIQAFLSHNWSTPRPVKFVALAFHFNHRSASAAALAACCAGFALTCTGVLPVYGMTYHGGTENRGHYCTVLSLVTYWFVLLTYQDAALRTGRRGTRVFLDKCCIHQTDERLKRKGIEQLGAFLAKADTMLIIYSDTYTKKLWTMYELATFLAIRGPGRLVVVPAFLASMIPKAFACAAAYSLVSELLCITVFVDYVGFSRSTVTLLTTLTYLPLLVAANALFRWWAHEQRRMLEAPPRHFNYANATCFVESDRELVNGNIARYMKDLSLNQATTDEQALSAFNSLVSAEVPAALSKSLGPLGLPTRYRFIIALPAIMLLVDSTAAAIKADSEPRHAAIKVLSALAMSMLWLVSFTLMAWLTQRFLWIQGGPREWLLILGCSALDGGHQFGFYSLLVFARGRALDGENWPVVLLVLIVIFFLSIICKAHTSASAPSEMDLGYAQTLGASAPEGLRRTATGSIRRSRPSFARGDEGASAVAAAAAAAAAAVAAELLDEDEEDDED